MMFVQGRPLEFSVVMEVFKLRNTFYKLLSLLRASPFPPETPVVDWEHQNQSILFELYKDLNAYLWILTA